MTAAKRMTLTQWVNVFRNMNESGRDFEITWLDSGNEWVINCDEELFEDDFNSEDRACDRLDLVKSAVRRGIYFVDPRENGQNEPIDTFKLVDVNLDGSYLIFNVLDGHCEVDKEFVNNCSPISKERYEEINKSWYR